ALFTLPIAQYPEITPPTVEVSASYPGANAQVVADTVAAPIEEQVNGVEGMMYMSSQCTNDGNYSLIVTFKPGSDLNISQVLVQTRESLAEPRLPELVKRRGISVKKKSPNVLMIVNLFSKDGSRTNLELSNYATVQIRDHLSRVSGVGDITYLGQRDYSMRLWLDPQKLSNLNLNAQDVINAVQAQNIPPGIDYAIVYDTTPFINESIHEVYETLMDAIVLVAFIVLLFLQNWRSTLIPLIAVPVAVIGTFAVMAAIGFSLNNLTLFG